MYRSLTHHLQQRADLLLAGSLAELAGHYSLPQAVFHQSRRTVLFTSDEVVAMLGGVRLGMQKRRVQTCTAQVTALELARNGRFRAWASLHEHAADPSQSRVSRLIYYFCTTPQGLKTEMLECLRPVRAETPPDVVRQMQKA